MSSSRVQAPPVNLKERIAALQQRNASSSQRLVSPAPTSAAVPASSTGALREKIARFERKGGVPVPRGSFGLGAPPPSDGHPRRQGELYGNRIPQPVRVVSGGNTSPGTTRSTSPSHCGPSAGDKRRSFSLSNITDYSDSQDYTPLTSPSSPSPPSSPRLPSNDTSVSDSIPGNATTPPPSSFATALEFARSVEKAAILDDVDIGIPDEPETSDEAITPSLAVPPTIIISAGEGSIEDVIEATELPPVEEEEEEVLEGAILDDKAPRPEVPQLPEEDQGASVHPVTVGSERDSTSSIAGDHSISEPFTDSYEHSVNDVHGAGDSIPEPPNPQAQGTVPVSETKAETVDSPSAPFPVPLSHIPISRAVDPGPSSDEVQNTSISEIVLSDDGNGSISPVVPIASPSGLLSQLLLLRRSQELGFEEASPPAFSFDNAALSSDEAILSLDPPPSTDVMTPSNVEASSDNSAHCNVNPIEVVGAQEEDYVVEVVITRPPSPSTPHAFQSHFPPETPPAAAPAQTLSSKPDLEVDCNSESIRPTSMIELSPSHVHVAHRVTPPTSRGVPVFLPSASPPLPRKSDLVYYPPTPPNEKQHFGVEGEGQELGSVTILHQRSLSTGEAIGSHSRLPSFRAVVHNKIREVAPIINHGPLIPETPQVKRVGLTRARNQPPPSPASNDLNVLLQDIVLLQQTLEQGTLPTETPKVVADDGQDTVARQPEGVEVRRLSKEEAEESRKTLVKLQAKREEQAKSKLRSTFRTTLARAKLTTSSTTSLYMDATSSTSTSTLTGALQPHQQNYARRFRSPSVPHLLDSVNEDASAGLRPRTPEQQVEQGVPPPVTSKSPRSRFPSFGRLGSGSKSSRDGHANGHTRHSASTSSEISSEDSALVAVTPPDNAMEFGEIADEHGKQGNVGLSWPSLSPSKKGAGGISRAATFAGKMWQRARTRSGALSIPPDRITSEPPPALPPLPQITPPSPELEGIIIKPPNRTTSLKSLRAASLNQSLPPSPPPPPLPPKNDDIFVPPARSRSATPQPMTRSSSLAPESPSRRDDNMRPTSWVSVSSADSTLPSILDQELFDAFPSVPQGHPLALSVPSPLLPSPKRELPVGARIAPSFDAALLSSAAHLTVDRRARLPPTFEPKSATGLRF